MTATNADEAISNGDAYATYETGMCQKFVRGPCWEVGSLYGSAIEAWNGAADKHPGDRNPPDGAPCYYAGGNYGHAVLYRRSDIRSTDCRTAGQVGTDDLAWPEQAWGYTYLGWTGDLNGVQLPLGEDAMALSDQDMDRIRDVVADVVTKYVGDVVKWPTSDDPENTITVRSAVATLQEIRDLVRDMTE